MTQDIIEILTPFGSRQVTQRMKFEALIKLKSERFEFRPFGQGGADTAAVFVNSLFINLAKDEALRTQLEAKSKTALVMLLVADFYANFLENLRLWSTVVDVFLVPTPEMKSVLSALTERRVEILLDPIDFGLNTSVKKSQATKRPKVVWFGYPESYGKSMMAYHADLTRLHKNQEIEYHLVAKNKTYGQMNGFVMHEFQEASFPALLETFDLCVLSHMPLDFSASTFWKSENKAVLAINRGLPTLASRTPAYARLLEQCGLADYLFSSSAELLVGIRRLSNWQEQQRYLSLSQDFVLAHYAPEKMAHDWVVLYEQARAQKFAVAYAQ